MYDKLTGWLLRAAAASMALAAAGLPLQAAEPSALPQFVLNLGTHNNSIWQMAVDPAGEFFVTASSDRTLRVWDTATGELQQTLRPPVNPGSEGWFGSVAVSPDGTTIAAGGGLCRTFESSYCVYLFDRASGALKQRILGFPSHVSRVVFSPDGRLLLALTTTDGVRLHRVQDGSLAGEDRDFGKQPAYTAAFSRDGLALVGSRDGLLRLYRTGPAGLERIVKRPAHSRGSPHAAAFSPDGTKVAVTHIFNGNNISILDAKTLDLLYNADTRTDKHGFISIDWSADGRMLLAGTSAFDEGIRFVRAYADGGKGTFRNIEVSPHNIEDLKALPRGGFIAVTRDVSIAAYDGEFKPVFRINPSFPNYIYRPGTLRVSRNGLAFSLPGGDAAFDPVSKRYLAQSPDNEMAEPLTGGKSLRVTAWRDSPNVNLDGKRLALVQPGNETSRALAIAADESSFVLGTSRGVYRFDREGKRLWSITWPGEVVAINFALDGKLVVAAQVNGTIRYLRAGDGKLASLHAKRLLRCQRRRGRPGRLAGQSRQASGERLLSAVPLQGQPLQACGDPGRAVHPGRKGCPGKNRRPFFRHNHPGAFSRGEAGCGADRTRQRVDCRSRHCPAPAAGGVGRLARRIGGGRASRIHAACRDPRTR